MTRNLEVFTKQLFVIGCSTAQYIEFCIHILIKNLSSIRILVEKVKELIRRFKTFANKVSKNNTRAVWVLKCDIKKFFASVDHKILIGILESKLNDVEIIELLKKVIRSFQSMEKGKGLPLGNLTSQLLVNIYMNEFDQYVKHTLKVKHYIRYADDFVFIHQNKISLLNLLSLVREFLVTKLKLEIHPHKTFLKTLYPGVDFLGFVHFPHHKILRTSTKRIMF